MSSSSLGVFKLWWAISLHFMGKAWGNEGLLVKSLPKLKLKKSHVVCIHGVFYFLLSRFLFILLLFHRPNFSFSFFKLKTKKNGIHRWLLGSCNKLSGLVRSIIYGYIQHSIFQGINMTQFLHNRHFRCEENYTHSYYVAEWWNSISVKSWFSCLFFFF